MIDAFRMRDSFYSLSFSCTIGTPTYKLPILKKVVFMSESSVYQMRIFELRNKLKEVGLPSSGTKTELISRLSQYYQEQNKKNEATNKENNESESKLEGRFVFKKQLNNRYN